MAQKAVCVLVSGGLDSGVLVAHFLSSGFTVWPVFVAQGLRWETAERFWLTRFLKSVTSPQLRPLATLAFPMTDVYGAHWSTGRRAAPGAKSRDEAVYLPGRNLALSR